MPTPDQMALVKCHAATRKAWKMSQWT